MDGFSILLILYGVVLVTAVLSLFFSGKFLEWYIRNKKK